MNALRFAPVVLTVDGHINAFVATEDGREVRSIEIEENLAYDHAAELFSTNQIASLDVGVVVEEHEYRFNCDPTYEGQLEIVVLGSFRKLQDGMIDFNWYYNLWSHLLRNDLTTTGVEFSVFD